MTKFPYRRPTILERSVNLTVKCRSLLEACNWHIFWGYVKNQTIMLKEIRRHHAKFSRPISTHPWRGKWQNLILVRASFGKRPIVDVKGGCIKLRQLVLGSQNVSWEADGTGSESCPVVGLAIITTEPSRSNTCGWLTVVSGHTAIASFTLSPTWRTCFRQK